MLEKATSKTGIKEAFCRDCAHCLNCVRYGKCQSKAGVNGTVNLDSTAYNNLTNASQSAKADACLKSGMTCFKQS